MIGIAINGYFGIFQASDNPGTPSWAWLSLAVIGTVIIGAKTLNAPQNKRMKLLLADLLFIGILLFFVWIPLPNGMNYVIGPVLAAIYLHFYINARLLN